MIENKIARTDHLILDIISHRWSPRAFAERPIAPEVLQCIFEAARWAPSSRNEQPWRFIVARKEDDHYQKLFAGLDEFNQRWAWTAPVLTAVLAVKKHVYKDRSNIYHLHDVGLAVGNLLAQATHEGLAVHQMGGINPDAIAESFDLNQEDIRVVSMMAIGYQDENRLQELDDEYQNSEFKARERKDLQDLVFGSSLTENPEWLK